MKSKLTLSIRTLLGLIFVVFGFNYFLHFIPLQIPPGPATDFMGALMASGYFFPSMKVIEITSGLLLLSGFYVPLALLLLVPIIFEISLFHIFLAPSGIPMAVVLILSEGYLAWIYRETYAPIFRKK